MADAVVVIDPAKVQQFIRDGNGPVFLEMVKRGERVKAEAKRRVGKQTHNLENRIVKRVVEVDGLPAIAVGWVGVPYGILHHEGTRPHTIRARKAKVLKFYSARAGKTIYTKQVNHPGTKPNRFLTDALRVA